MRRTALAGTALAMAAGCGDSWMDDYSFVWHGENVTVYGYDLHEADACAGSFGTLDRHVGAIKEYLWVSSSTRYNYRWLSDEYWTELDPCSSDAFACAVNGDALSRLIPDMHEAVHMVTDSVGTDGCPSVLDEGLAVYFGEPIFREWDPSGSDIQDLLIADPIPHGGTEYARAGHFVSFLLERYGAGSVVLLCNALPSDATMEDWGLAVGRVLDIPLSLLISEYENGYPLCTFPQFRARATECAGEVDFAFSTADDAFSVHSSCLDSRAMNVSWGAVGNAVMTRRVYFPKDTWVVVTVASMGDSGTSASFSSEQCAPCSADPQVIQLEEEVSLVHYRAGVHEVIVFFDKRDAVRLQMVPAP